MYTAMRKPKRFKRRVSYSKSGRQSTVVSRNLRPHLLFSESGTKKIARLIRINSTRFAPPSKGQKSIIRSFVCRLLPNEESCHVSWLNHRCRAPLLKNKDPPTKRGGHCNLADYGNQQRQRRDWLILDTNCSQLYTLIPNCYPLYPRWLSTC